MSWMTLYRLGGHWPQFLSYLNDQGERGALGGLQPVRLGRN